MIEEALSALRKGLILLVGGVMMMLLCWLVLPQPVLEQEEIWNLSGSGCPTE